MNFYSPVSNTIQVSFDRAYNENSKNQNPGRQSREMEKSLGRECNFEEVCILSLERNIGKEDEFRVSGGSESQSRGPMTEKALLPSDDRTYVWNGKNERIRRSCRNRM